MPAEPLRREQRHRAKASSAIVTGACWQKLWARTMRENRELQTAKRACVSRKHIRHKPRACTKVHFETRKIGRRRFIEALRLQFRCGVISHTTLAYPVLVYGVEERGIWITYVKDHHPQWIRATAIVARHFHMRRHHHRLSSFHREWFAPFHFQGKCAFQNIDSHWETVCMEHGPIARLEARRENAHLLRIALGHSLDDLVQE